MLPVVEIPGLTKAEADQRAIDLGIDSPTIEIIRESGGLFTVRATYPEGMIIPGATSAVADNSAPFELTGLSQAAVDEEVAVFKGSGSTFTVIPEAGNLFTIRISPPKAPALVEPPPTVVPNAPDLDGYVLCLDRIRTERRPGMGFDRTVSRYQAYFNRAPIADVFGMAVERQGPDDNGSTGVARHRRIAAGIYPLFTHASGATNKYKTIGYARPANIRMRPWPCIGVEETGSRSGILIHCAAGYLMSTGCINLTSNVISAGTNLLFSDSWARVTALIDSIKEHLGDRFPNSNNTRLPHVSLVIRDGALV
ncbi:MULTISPECIES: hypothetical protein [Bradyrhizobium]|uniref:YkuD domain-containing protein n=1 Tax=Bradyrhizobium vignae TaxID=1549949 RepID=A0ABS3ZTP6_9BRAD|nr:hypothetical protein [Bradyrhizobium vignae]MBP0111103.1 hypothetical protein [Bradyrhizobium vignae]RXG88763.1 hypothetical protein EAV90_30490 [Bradyrhizobium vignae]